MIFRQLFEPQTSTFTYLLGCESTGRALLIDPVEAEVPRYLKILDDLGLSLTYTLETHVHADHITGAGRLRTERGSRSIVHRDSGAWCADLLVSDGIFLQVGHLEFDIRHTPGHTAGCISIVMPDRVFTGDSLLIGGCGRTDFQEGDAGRLFDSIHQKIFSLPPDTLIYPGHDYHGRTVSTVQEEQSSNPRLKRGSDRQTFIDLMDHLDLATPQQMHEAIPANLACGTP